MSPLAWKSKTIPQVCKSAKAAETRALDTCADEAIFVARVLNEMLTGKKGQSKEKQMRVIIKCDSMGLKETLNSTHQIEEKMLRPVVQNIKDLLTREFIESVTWVPTEECQADLLTKKGSGCKERVIEIIQSGDNKSNLYLGGHGSRFWVSSANFFLKSRSCRQKIALNDSLIYIFYEFCEKLPILMVKTV